MDDNKNKEKLTENEELRGEMDELARIFKEELDKTKAEAELSESYEVEGYDPRAVSFDGERAEKSEDKLCECCGERPRGTAENPDSPFCEECEGLMEKYPYDWKGVLAVILTVGLALAAVTIFMTGAPIFTALKEGDSSLRENKLFTAAEKYETAVSYLPENSRDDYLGVYAKYVKAQYKLLNMEGVIGAAGTYFSDAQLKLPMFGEVRKMNSEMRGAWLTASIIQKHLAEYENLGPENYDAAIAMLDSLSGKTIYVKNGEPYDDTEEGFSPDGVKETYIYDEGWLNIYKYSVALVCEKDKETALGFLEKAKQVSAHTAGVVNPLLASTYAGTGDYEKAAECAEEMKKANSEGADYYMITSMLFRYRDKDFKKAADICDEGLKTAEKASSLYLQKSLALIMSDDFGGAYDSVKACYEAQTEEQSLTLPVRDLYAMLALKTGDSETFERLRKEIEDYPEDAIEFSEDVENFRTGKITLREIAESGRYDAI